VAKRKAAMKTAGRRVGTKKRDMRWEVDGEIWASKFEFEVYDGLSKQLGSGQIRRCTEEDQLDYQSQCKNSNCAECGSNRVVQRRKFTPDLFVVSPSAAGRGNKQSGYFIEAKGYLRADRRTLLRDFVKCHPNLDLRFVIEKDYKATSTLSLGQWIDRYLKKRWIVWNGRLPKDWL
jgi:hypothetical protein